ncbi:MAG: carboxylating nicotinate-nucleotide diphosphorylase [Lysobacteraceae bacterium]
MNAGEPALIAAQAALDAQRALDEDLGSGDVSAALIPAGRGRAHILCREACVLAGAPWVEACFRRLDPAIELDWQAGDGQHVAANQTVLRLHGDLHALLSGERTALNFLQTLSATATATAACVAAVAGLGTRILDTRKTLPGLRLAQKYAVRCGGGDNHRFGLFDAVMLKENHLAAAGGVAAALGEARRRFPDLPLILEVETAEQLDEALACGAASRILLDNFDLDALRRAVARVAGRVPLEASGGLDLDSLRAVAETGVDFISTGAITKHVRAVDLSMRMENA